VLNITTENGQRKNAGRFARHGAPARRHAALCRVPMEIASRHDGRRMIATRLGPKKMPR